MRAFPSASRPLAAALLSIPLAAGCGTSSIGPTLGDGAGENTDAGEVGVRDLAQLAGDYALTQNQTDLRFNPDAFWAQDPPVMYCAGDGGMPPKVPGGTPDCPDDKNREGCPCPAVGMTASCWPGLRKNRGLGICMDGKTTCQQVGEVGLAWGPCAGFTLPAPGATSGKNACQCFSGGRWELTNLSPCYYDFGMGPGTAGAASTVEMGGMSQCADMQKLPLVLPMTPWSSDTVTADCAGHFKLCYTLKAGDSKNPSPNDCVVATSCVEAGYTTPNVAQPFPPVPAWVSNDLACTLAFSKQGYGEMSVDGTSILCDAVKKVFNRVTYCPLACNQMPNDPMCKDCMQGGGGNF